MPWLPSPYASICTMNTRGLWAVGSTVAVVGVGVYIRCLRPWQLHWGATDAEVNRVMPGDDLVPHPTMSATRAITIHAPPHAVWPWLVQMGGYTRAGWYSYDRFDNAGVPSADRIVPELQELEVGDVMLTSPTDGFVVHAVDPGRHLVLLLDHEGSRITSVPLLSPLGKRHTRLIFRVRAHFRPRHWPFAAAFDIGDFLFMRKQLLGIKDRSERLSNDQPSGQRPNSGDRDARIS